MEGTDYEVLSDGKTVWINAADGSSIGRFSRFGIDVHKTLENQMKGEGQCLDCTHSKPSIQDWERFRTAMKSHHAVEVEECHMPDFLK